MLLEWASTGGAFPDSLDEIDPQFRAELSTTDGWGKEFLYRKVVTVAPAPRSLRVCRRWRCYAFV